MLKKIRVHRKHGLIYGKFLISVTDVLSTLSLKKIIFTYTNTFHMTARVYEPPEVRQSPLMHLGETLMTHIESVQSSNTGFEIMKTSVRISSILSQLCTLARSFFSASV